jgi:hypothetical protein
MTALLVTLLGASVSRLLIMSVWAIALRFA